MSVTAIVCELNPLHNGPMHVMKAAEGDAVVLVMSGNFTQRALSAAFHKYARAEAAVRSGADLVVVRRPRASFGYCADSFIRGIPQTFFGNRKARSSARRGCDKIEGARHSLPRIFP